MSNFSVLNLGVTITVSDPWEFGTECGTGPFGGVISDVTSDRLVVRLSTPIVYRGRVLSVVHARPRHLGDTPATVGLRPLHANLILFPDDGSITGHTGTETTRQGVSAVGTIGRLS
jgi:hypothetical protein